MKCPYCGNEQPDAGFCGKCGANLQQSGGQPNPNYGYNQNPYQQQQSYYQPPNQQGGGGNFGVEEANRKAKNGLIFGIIGIICIPFLGIVALIMGIQANKVLKAANAPTGNAIVAIVLGIIAVVEMVLSIILIPIYMDMITDILSSFQMLSGIFSFI